MPQLPIKPVIKAAAMTTLLTLGTSAHGAGFQISEQSLSGMGRAFAGAGISGDDASDLFYNPAGMMLNDGRQFQIGLTAISPEAEFENQGSTQTFRSAAGAQTVPSRGTNADGGDDALVPHMYYTFPRNGAFKYGIGISAPFGLATEYDKDWIGRYHAIRSELKTIDVNPAVAYEVSETLSIGAGLSIQKAEAELSRAVFLGPTAPVDGKANVEGDDTALGFNLGIMAGDDDARFGLGIRSKTKQTAEGFTTINVPGMPTTKLPAKATVTLPETVYLSGFKKLSDKADLLGSVRWTNWSRFEELRVTTTGLPDSVTEENWEDTFTISIGTNVRLDNGWTLRAGLSHDESPVPSADLRTPRIPDTDRDWLTLGAGFKTANNVTIDIAFAHLFTDGSEINNTIDLVSSAPGAFTDNLVGEFTSADANLFGVQFLWEF